MTSTATATAPTRHRLRPRDIASWHSHIDHAADRAARAALMAQLIDLRTSARLGREQVVARYPQHGYDPIDARALFNTERKTSWQIRTIQALARMYDRRLDIEILGLTVPDDGDPLSIMYAAMRPTTAAAMDELAREVLINNLARIRRSMGITQLEVGDAFGIGASAICSWESGSPGVTFRSTQRIARYYGGRLAFHLRPVETACPR